MLLPWNLPPGCFPWSLVLGKANCKSGMWNALLLDSWFPKTLGIIFGLACFTAIIVIVCHYGSKPSPDLALGITLNAIISMLATASKYWLIKRGYYFRRRNVRCRNCKPSMMLAAGHGDLSPLWRSLPSALFCGLGQSSQCLR
ncbi:uncharacterized protein BDW43DRAFT_291899 [Aspergillus alliaceus]|uniref:uncharacterized protein n=1 Tax=Petromyces alliaceus TaxID=209559 RepID=UPI0012A4E358|nr:uncharacterized protein BDW43DRAFT_291899 [Aspergillus alliaceus]KAB8228263.1 hypothetical protein BDW43DRAFT_291899 [Aspergillus alliaceus]